METKHRLLWISYLLLCLGGFTTNGVAQNKKERDSIQAALIKTLVTEQRYIFLAQTATPSRGGLRQITGTYTLKVTKDTVMSDLPYMGRSYTAGYGSGEGGIKFTSTGFEYKSEPRKKGGWEITIKPKEMNTCRDMNLIVYEDGTASLNVNLDNKQPISFRGYITDKIK